MEINNLFSTLNLKEKSQRKTKTRMALYQTEKGKRENHFRTSTNSKSRERVCSRTLYFLSFYNLLIVGFTLVARYSFQNQPEFGSGYTPQNFFKIKRFQRHNSNTPIYI